MTLQTFIDMGDNESIQGAIDDMENLRDRGLEYFGWILERLGPSKDTPVTNAPDAFRDAADCIADHVLLELAGQIRLAKEAMNHTPEAVEERQAEIEAQQRIVI